jgi:peptidoglycan/xylan/chitin deacetylase (PgdA/CDA1 family)
MTVVRFELLRAAGFSIATDAVGRIADAFAESPDAAALVPGVVVRSTDTRYAARWEPGPLDVPALLADPRTLPPVIAINCDAAARAGGFDSSFGSLAAHELCIRMALQGAPVVRIPGDLVFCDAGAGPLWLTPPDEMEHLARWRRILEAHRPALDAHLREVIIRREAGYGRLRDLHLDAVARRDADLRTLDDLRAGSAHHLAFLKHHGRDHLDWGDLRRTDPVSRDWGYDRGGPVDRRFIESFVEQHSSDVKGVVLEVQEGELTRHAGGPRVTRSEILDVNAANEAATIIADLRDASDVASDGYDCIILTQTLHVIDDMAAALRECHRLLKTSGVLLATFPSASRVCLEYGERGDFWRTTPAGVQALVEPVFGAENVGTSTFGNVLTNVAFLHGIGRSELTDEEYATADPYFPALVGLRGTKGRSASRDHRGVVLLYHRVCDDADGNALSVPPALFEEHVSWLATHANVVSLTDLLSRPAASLPPRAVALTFDDGYLDNLTAASPILQQHHMPATFFLTTRWLEETGEYWWDLLERKVRGRSGVAAEAYQRQHDELVHASLADRDAAVAGLRALPESRAARHRPLLADEVKALAAMPGVTIGAHTVNHLALPDQSEDVCVPEIEGSRATLARLIGQPVDLVAYPYGAVDRATAALVRRRFAYGLSCHDGAVGESFDAAQVPRVEVSPLPVDEFAARVERAWAPAGRPCEPFRLS